MTLRKKLGVLVSAILWLSAQPLQWSPAAAVHPDGASSRHLGRRTALHPADAAQGLERPRGTPLAARRVLLTSAAGAAASFIGVGNPRTARGDVVEILGAAARNSEITYSSNAKNFARLGEGDSSAGSVYEEPKSPAAAKRRAMTGCKFAVSRKEAGEENEQACNGRVLSGDTVFMLDALRRLDCPTCAYGIKGAK